MRLLQTNRILIVHPFLWAFFILCIIVVRLLVCGYTDIAIKDAEAKGQTDILLQLPVSALGEIRIERKDL